MRTVVGLFESGNSARRAMEDLADLGFPPQAISVVTNAAARSVIESDSRSPLRSMSLSDVGTVAASGPLAEAAGTPNEPLALAGLLQRIGFSRELAGHYAMGVERGQTLESITVDDADVDRVAALMKKNAAGSPGADEAKIERETFEENGGLKKETGGAAASAGIAASVRAVGRAVASKIAPERIAERRGEDHVFAEEQRTIPVYREELSVGKREVERGAVRVTTHVIERPYAEQVLLREEHVDVERRPAGRLVRQEESEFKDSEIEMREFGEEAVGAKQTRLVEEVVIRRHVADRTATVGDTLRSTEVDVRSFDASRYRRHFEERRLGGAKFEEHARAYRLGEELRRPGSSARWEDVEPDARARWEAERAGTWDEFKDSIRYAWSQDESR